MTNGVIYDIISTEKERGIIMHYLHKILIETDGETDKNCLREVALDRLEPYQNNVYDWLEYESAGRWADEYPDNVLLGCENVEALIEAIKESKETQDKEKEYCLQMLNTDSIKEVMEATDTMKHYYLYKLATIVEGAYNIDSYFYNSYDGDTIINDKLFEYIRENKDNLALVIVDVHI